MIDRNLTSAEKDQSESDGCHGERKLVSMVAHQPVMPMHFPDGYNEIDADCESRGASEESNQDQQAA
jgi:hypothetical protein